MSPGHHYVNIALNEVPLFIRKAHSIPLVDPANTVDTLDWSTLTSLGYENASYRLVTEKDID